MTENVTATADYHPGKRDTAIVIVHGFLTTRNFRTVYHLSNALLDEGYTVLAPTLSLGVSRRKISLACEAIHTHSIDDDIREIQYWVDWLVAKKYKKIMMVGHSFGSLEILLYQLRYKNPVVKGLVATSLIGVGRAESKAGQLQIAAAKKMLAHGDNKLGEFQLSYCKKYIAPPKAFLSYAVWDRKRILSAINKTHVPFSVILGGADKRMDNGWLDALKKHGVRLKIIKGANHFFDALFEFDLLDSVLASLGTDR